MGLVERYLRNRSVPQIVANYVGFVGACFFALQNLTTNWAGDYTDDNSLADSIKSNYLAGTAWDEQFLQVGGMQTAWALYVLGAELQGNLSPGRYKRFMTWGVNTPVIAFMIGNMILSRRRIDDGVESDSGQTANIVFGCLFIAFSLANIAIFALTPRYKAEAWFAIKDIEHGDDDRPDTLPLRNNANGQPDGAGTGPKAFGNNRFWPQTLLNFCALCCLLYFVLIGWINYGSGRGWLLTNTWSRDALAVKVWDIGGASVAMMAFPVFLMFVALESMGDLPPNNYKPTMVWVACINIFVSSTFLYATTWDAYDRGVITSNVLPLVIMICLCVFAIALIIAYAFVDKYADAYWIKVLADPLKRTQSQAQVAPQYVAPVWQAKPVVVDAGYRHFDLAWQPLPDVPSASVEYRVLIMRDGPKENPCDITVVPGDQPHLHVDRFQGEPIANSDKFVVSVDFRDLGSPDARWVVAMEDRWSRAAPLPMPLPANYTVAPRLVDATPDSVTAQWDAVPNQRPRDIEYVATVSTTDPASGERASEERVLPGEQTRLTIDHVQALALAPEQTVNVNVAFRRKADATEPLGGWQAASGNVPLTTAAPAAVPQDEWRSTVRTTHVGSRRVEVAWLSHPTLAANEVQYFLRWTLPQRQPEFAELPGDANTFTIDSFGGRALEPHTSVAIDVSYRRATDDPDAPWTNTSTPCHALTKLGPDSTYMCALEATDATPTSVSAKWNAPDDVPDTAVQYRLALSTSAPAAADGGDERKLQETMVLPGHQHDITVRSVANVALQPRQTVTAQVAIRSVADADDEDGGWRATSQKLEMQTRKPAPPSGWRAAPFTSESGAHHVCAQWEPVPELDAKDVQYRVTVAHPSGATEQFEVQGDNTTFMIDEFDGRQLQPGDELRVSVEYRDVDDREAADGGWKGHSGMVAMSTKSDVPQDWRVPLQLSGRGTKHITVQWQQPPGTNAPDLEYRVALAIGEDLASTLNESVVPGTTRQLRVTSIDGRELVPSTAMITQVAFRHARDSQERNGGWQCASHRAIFRTLDPIAAPGWKLAPVETGKSANHVAIKWDAPPDSNPAAIEYNVSVARAENRAEADQYVLPGDSTTMDIRQIDSRALGPQTDILVTLSARYVADAEYPEGGWQHDHDSAATPFRTGNLLPEDDFAPPLSVSDRGAHHVNLAWDGAPGVDDEDVEYMVVVEDESTGKQQEFPTGSDRYLALTSFAGKPLHPGDEFRARVMWRPKGATQWTDPTVGKPDSPASIAIATKSDGLPQDWQMSPVASEVGKRHVNFEWRAPPNTVPRDIEYRVTVRSADGSRQAVSVLPGTKTTCVVRDIDGQPITPGQPFTLEVEYRQRSDAGEEGAGWQRSSGARPFQSHPSLEEWTVRAAAGPVSQAGTVISWKPPPVPDHKQWEYHVRVSDGESKETSVVNDLSYHLAKFQGEPVRPGSHFTVNVESRLKVDSGDADGGWGHASLPVKVAIPVPKPVVEEQKVDMDFSPQVSVLHESLADVTVGWKPVPGTKPEDIEYLLQLQEGDGDDSANAWTSSRRVYAQSGNVASQKFVLPGSATAYFLDEFAGEPIIPGEHFRASIKWRLKKDGQGPEDGWRGHGALTDVWTQELTEAAVLLESRVPRVHILEPLTFKTNKADISEGAEALPAIAKLMLQHSDMELAIEGHVNFGQKQASALRLSKQRAEMVLHALVKLGVAPGRVRSTGFGHDRPRFPRGSPFAKKNRRVEFRIVPGSALYTRLQAQAEARKAKYSAH